VNAPTGSSQCAQDGADREVRGVRWERRVDSLSVEVDWISTDNEGFEGRTHVAAGPDFGDGGIAYVFLRDTGGLPEGMVFWQWVGEARSSQGLSTNSSRMAGI
jgi:hypothetical protein